MGKDKNTGYTSESELNKTRKDIAELCRQLRKKYGLLD